jgi:transposase
MARITRAAAHVSAEVAKWHMKTTKTALYRQRWLIVYTALVAQRSAEGIAKQCGVSKATVHAMISTYNRLGTEAVETVGKGNRHHELLTREQERELLTPFFARAVEGEIATAAEVQAVYEQRVGHDVHLSTVYRLLDRHGWRKLLPRPRHPEADHEEQERFKKPLRARWRRLWQRDQPRISAPC